MRVAAVLGLAKRTGWSEYGPVCAINDAAYAVLLAALEDNDPVVRAAAASALRNFGRREEPQTIEALNPLLDDANLAVRRAAATTLLTCENVDPKALGVLGSQVRHTDINVRIEAAFAFCMIGTRARSMMPDLLVLLDDVSPVVRQHAARALGMLAQGLEEGEFKHVVAELNAVVDDKNSRPMVRMTAAVGLVQARSPPPKAIAMLRQGLRDADPEIRLATLRMVSASSNFPKELVVALEDLLDESSPEMRRLAASVLQRKE